MREKLIELIYKYISLRILSENKRIGRKPKVTAEMSINALASFLIENGVVIPVRCGECAFSKKQIVFEHLYNCILHEQFVDKNDYCSYGEPKKSEE